MFKSFRFLLKYIWKFNKMYIVYISALQLFSAALPLLSTVMSKYIIDELTTDRRVDRLILLVSILIGYNLIGGWMITFLNGRCFTSKGIVFQKFQTFMAEKLSLCDLEQLEDPEFLDAKEKAQQFLYANGQGFGVALDSAIKIIGKIFVFAGLIVILSTLNIFVVLLFIAIVLVSGYFESKVRADYVKWDMEKTPIERKTGYYMDLNEDFSYGKEIRLYNFREKLVSKISEHLRLSNEFYKKQTKDFNRVRYFNTAVSFVREAISYGYLIWQMVAGVIAIGDFTMYLSALAQFSGAMNEVMSSILDMKQYGAYYNELEKYMNIPATMREGEKLPLPDGEYEIEFKEVSFRYPGQTDYALRDVNIVIHAGEKLSVVGENGAGKTTFVKLLTRMYDPTSGSISLNGIDIRRIDYDKYQSVLSAVFQDFQLFSFTLRENIVLGTREPNDDSEVIECLKKSGFGDKLERLEKGIYTNVYKNFEPDGFEPSGGEAQKIALARALYKDAPIVILDEPNAALDPRAEYELYQQFNDLVRGKTAIYISHRLSSAKFCDRIAVFKTGTIAECGTHGELMKKHGLYAELFNMQAQYYVDSDAVSETAKV